MFYRLALGDDDTKSDTKPVKNEDCYKLPINFR